MRRLVWILLWAALPQTAAAELACPEGTVLREKSSDAMHFAFCGLRDGVYHGPAAVSYPDGKKRMEGEFRNGAPVGTWRAWFSDEKPHWEGGYEPDSENDPGGNHHRRGLPRPGQSLRLGGRGPVVVPRGFSESYGPVWGRRTGTWIQWHSGGAMASEMHYRAGAKHGPALLGYANGQRRSQGSYDADEQEGPWITWYESGSKKAEGSYDAGEQEGRWITWHESGNKKSEGSYRAGHREGLWVTWNPDGSKGSEVHYRAGKRQGPAVLWYANGKKQSQGSYADGKQEGRWTVWNDDARREGEAYRGGVKTGVWTHFYPTGEKAGEESWDGKAKGRPPTQPSRDGPYRLWHRNGQLKEEGSYRGDLRHGRWAAWYETGQPLYEGHWVDGRRHGLWSFWSHDGRLVERASWAEGEPHGPWTRWHRTGHLRMESAYIRSKADGPWRVWYANGQLAEEGAHTEGQMIGPWRYWYPHGSLKHEGRHEAGRPTGRWVRYRQDGQKEEEGEYRDGKKEGIWTEWREDGGRIETVWSQGRGVERTEHPAADSPPARIRPLMDLLDAGTYPLPPWSLDCPEGTRGFEERNVDGAKTRGCVDQQDEKHGPWVGWYDDDRKWFEREYDHGKEVGTWREWHENGQLAKVRRLDIRKGHNEFETWSHDGKKLSEGRYALETKVGIWRTWHTTGVLSREEHYDESGHKTRWLSWNYEGQMLERGETHPDGRRQRVTSFHPASGLRKSLHEGYNQFRRHGVAIGWRNNGFKSSEGRYFEDQKEGLWLTWKGDGRLDRVTEYRRGQEVGRIDE